VAALWDVWDGDGSELLSCTLVTTDAAPEFLPWHRRMPVLLSRDEMPRWLDNRVPIAANDPLFDSRLKFSLVLRALPRAVGNANNKNPAEMAGLGEEVVLEPGQGSQKE
jgi:putative SOS response-associated peptidase YedK